MILIVNALVWYGYATSLLVSQKDALVLSEVHNWVFYGINFGSATISMIIGASMAHKIRRRQFFLMAWTFLGIFVSIIPVFFDIGSFVNVLVVSTLMSASFGLGLPSTLAYFSDVTVAENRSKFAAVVLILDFFAAFVLKSAMSRSMVANFCILAVWRTAGLIAVPFLSTHDGRDVPLQRTSGIRLVQTRSYMLYLIPWLVFSVVNSFAWNIFARSHGEDFVYSWSLIERVVQGVSAAGAGLLADRLGRKRIIMSGLILFGLGYAILGVSPGSMFSWCFFTVADGIAWGIIFVIFFFTLWGDLAYGRPSENHYAIGILPYSLSSFMQVTVASFIADAIAPAAVFSLAAFFLFLAVMPLMYAPETLPEKKIQERELRVYLEKAKKVKQKYA
jgi:MFS family permease